jgi:predicted DNA binding protein
MNVEGWKDWMDSVLSRRDVNIRVVNCRPYGKSGMLQYVELSAMCDIEEVISQIKASPNVMDSEFTKTDKSRASGLVITKSSPVCRGISKYRGFCTTCLSADLQHNRWRIVLAGDDSLDKILSGLEKRGMSVKVTESKTLVNGTLTFDQHKIIRIAEQLGYFEFPRSITLTKLAERLHMSKSNLEEILRRAEHKIATNYVKRTNESFETTTR